MTESMVERVARAIHAAHYLATQKMHARHGLDVHSIAWSLEDDPTAANSLNEDGRQGYRDAARAAIEAMREPTPAMVAASRIVKLDKLPPYMVPLEKGGPLEYASIISEDGAIAHHRAMIDAALKE